MTAIGEPTPEALALLDTAPCGLLRTTEDGVFLRVNATFCNWVGRTAEELVQRMRFQELLPVGGRIFHQTHWSPLMRMQGSVSEVKFSLRHSDGSAIPMVLNGFRRAEGDAFVHDIAAYIARDRDRFEQELIASRKRLEELVATATALEASAKDRALFAEQMIGIVSHDLRNPLSTIVMASSMLGTGTPTAPQRRLIERIGRATDRAQHLIADLLDFTQARFGKGLSLEKTAFDLHEVVAETVEDLRLAHPATRLVHAQRGEGACAADVNRLAQLLGNLVSNAAAYGAPQAPITITSAIDAATFSVSVHNQGVPIPAAAQATMFEPMTRGTSEHSQARSVGLGLFIVREISRAHGGEARVRSALDEGTTFEVSFPRAVET